MKKITLNWIHLCDAASMETLTRKVSLLGIFTKVLLEEIPDIFPRFCIVTNFTFEELGPTHNRIEVKIFPPENPEQTNPEPLFVDFAEFELNISPGEKEEISSISDIDEIPMPGVGEYTVRVYFDGEELGRSTFVAALRKR